MRDVHPGMTPLAVSALALLEERPMHPYEMLQLLRDRGKCEIVTIKGGSLYHTMSRLAELGFAEVQGTQREGNRPERTLYGLTDAGREAYVAWVRSRLDQPTTPQEYAVALAEAHNLDSVEVARILSDRRDLLSVQADRLRTALHSARERGVPAAFFLELERRLALLDCDIAWTEGALTRLAADDIVWSYDDPRAGRRQAGQCSKENPQ